MMKHNVTNMTASDLQQRIASPHLTREQKASAIAEMEQRLWNAATRKVLSVADFIDRTN